MSCGTQELTALQISVVEQRLKDKLIEKEMIELKINYFFAGILVIYHALKSATHDLVILSLLYTPILISISNPLNPSQLNSSTQT